MVISNFTPAAFLSLVFNLFLFSFSVCFDFITSIVAGTKTIKFSRRPVGETITVEKWGFLGPSVMSNVCGCPMLSGILLLGIPLASKFSPLHCSDWPLRRNPRCRKSLVQSPSSLAFASEASSGDDDYKQCKHKVMNWASSALKSETDESNHELRDFLFFLHVPRTGGRTYHRCLLHNTNLNAWNCKTSYDQFRFDPRETKCRLLNSHDDYSVMSKLPKERTSVMTMIRNPIDRVFGTFEFSAEHASRFLNREYVTSVVRKENAVGLTNITVSAPMTLNIWPWKYLIPWMQADLRARRDARKHREQSNVTVDNPYDMGDFLMPLKDYIYDPVVRDLVHNGATFQIAGLTNYSIFEEAHEVRHCVIKFQNLGKFVLEVARKNVSPYKRLENMLFVGLTEKHEESASMLANIMGPQVLSRKEVSNSDPQVTKKRPAHHFPNVRSSRDPSASGNLTVEGLIEMYESCASPSKTGQSRRWVKSLKRIYSSKNFTKESCRLVPEEIIEEIASLNSLDVELHNYAKKIFMKQQQQQQRVSKSVTPYTSNPESISTTRIVFMCVGQSSYWILLSLFFFIAGLLLLSARYLSINRRISSKVRLNFKERREHIT